MRSETVGSGVLLAVGLGLDHPDLGGQLAVDCLAGGGGAWPGSQTGGRGYGEGTGGVLRSTLRFACLTLTGG